MECSHKEVLSHGAMLESKIDFLETELTILDTMLKKTGFSEGIKTLKETMVEYLDELHEL